MRIVYPHDVFSFSHSFLFISMKLAIALKRSADLPFNSLLFLYDVRDRQYSIQIIFPWLVTLSKLISHLETTRSLLHSLSCYV
jgi:hypothetical protein